MANDAPSVVASIEEFFTMVSAGLAGSTPHMISASITAITRILYEFHSLLDKQALGDLVQTVDLFLTSNNREIVSSVLGFAKVCTISLPVEMVGVRLPTLIPNLMRWSHEHKGHFRAKVKHILDRMVRRFGFDIVNKYCPEEDRKLISNIRKTKERNKRKNRVADKAGDESEDEEGDDGGERKTRGNRFDSGFDAALYSSDSDNSGDEGGDASAEHPAKERKKRGNNGGQAFILEEEGEPLDLLDRKAIASISSTRPMKMRKPGLGKAKFNADGKLVLGENASGNGNGDFDMDIDQEDGGAESGVNAYLSAVSGKDVAKRGYRGKLKWTNKRGHGGDDDDMMDEDEAAAIKAKLDKGPSGGRISPRGSGRNGRGSRGGNNGRGHSRSGSGRVMFGRRGLGEDKRMGGSSGGGRVAKSWPQKR
ncbi:hypothetical protein SPBR_04281 [Sporothrix brasiliensis 5110]|uniref:Uncharacterized protein n=1 Tax=Sporothrix brasiliensis 5110 TaxID=1398154 RepID=A0A0C2FR18_9PEZI|nr:uncharacterized protein SPBR_04281 [Sporothrix brasiliensis 5110]KIH93473.1 hypothetical protein SPBR_04281 [Sporothrix brasiliensis 5110]